MKNTKISDFKAQFNFTSKEAAIILGYKPRRFEKYLTGEEQAPDDVYIGILHYRALQELMTSDGDKDRDIIRRSIFALPDVLNELCDEINSHRHIDSHDILEMIDKIIKRYE